MSKKERLIARVRARARSFTWDEAVWLMQHSGFDLIAARGGGSARMFRHRESGIKVRLHEPHPQNTLLPYMLEQIEEGLASAGEIEKR